MSLALIEVEHVSKWYGAVIGVNDVSLQVEPGITALLGPNGSGKSTLMKLITGQLRPSIGTVRVLGRPVWRSATARRSIGFAPEGDHFYEEMTGAQFVYTMARLSGLSRREARGRTAAALEIVGMQTYSRKRMRGCSKGMRQRIKVAQALVHDPDVLILDEPLSGIDPVGRVELAALLRRLKEAEKTLLVSSHILEEVETVTDRIALIAWGRILASGSVREIRAMLKDHPLTVRISSDRTRELAAALVAHEAVVGVSLQETARLDREGTGEPGDLGTDLIVKVRTPERFFGDLPGLVLELGADVRAVDPLDESAAAVFAYLLGERAGGVG